MSKSPNQTAIEFKAKMIHQLPLPEIGLVEKSQAISLEQNIQETIRKHDEKSLNVKIEENIIQNDVSMKQVEGGWILSLENWKSTDTRQLTSIKSEINKASAQLPICQLIIENCSVDMIQIVLKLSQNKNVLRLLKISCKKSLINQTHLKFLIFSQKAHLKIIQLKEVLLHCENSLKSITQKNRILRFLSRLAMFSREQAIRTLFLQDYLKPCMLPNIKNIEISLERLLPEEKITEKQKSWEEKKYQSILSELQEEVQAHLIMKGNISYIFQVPFSYTIEQNTFSSKKGLQYSLNALKEGRWNIREIIFSNLHRPNLSIWKILAGMLRQMKIESISFVNVPLTMEHLVIVKNLFYWNKTHLQRIVFGGGRLSDNDLKFLVLGDNLFLTDFQQLNQLIVFDNEQLMRSEAYKTANQVMSDKNFKLSFSKSKPKTENTKEDKTPRLNHKDKMTGRENVLTTVRETMLLGEAMINNTTLRHETQVPVTQNGDIRITIADEPYIQKKDKLDLPKSIENDKFINPPNSLRQKQRDSFICDFPETDLNEGVTNTIHQGVFVHPAKNFQIQTIENENQKNKKISEKTIYLQVTTVSQDSDKATQDVKGSNHIRRMSGMSSTSRGKERAYGEDDERKRGKITPKHKGKAVSKQQFKEENQLKQMLYQMQELEAGGIFKAENEDALNTILKNHLLEKDASRKLDLRRVKISKCSELTLKYLLDYIPQSQRLEELSIGSYPKAFLEELETRLEKYKKFFELLDIEHEEEEGGDDAFWRMILIGIKYSEKIVLRNIKLKSTKSCDALCQMLEQTEFKQSSISINGLTVTENQVDSDSVCRLFANFLQRGVKLLQYQEKDNTKSAKKKKISNISSSFCLNLESAIRSPMIADIFQDCLEYHYCRVQIKELRLDSNLITSESLLTLLCSYSQSLTHLKITNLGNLIKLKNSSIKEREKISIPIDEIEENLNDSQVESQILDIDTQIKKNNSDKIDVENDTNSKISQFKLAMVECSFVMATKRKLAFTQLKEVDISQSHEQQDWITFLSILLQKSPNVKILKLQGSFNGKNSMLSLDDVVKLTKLFQDSHYIKSNQIEELDLSYNCLPEIHEAIPQLMAVVLETQGNSLKKLKICGGNEENFSMLSQQNLEKIANCFSKVNSQLSLQEIDLSMNSLSDSITKKQFSSLLEVILLSCPKLNSLLLTGKMRETMLTDEMAIQLSAIFNNKVCQNLQRLDLSQNLAISPVIFKELLRSILTNAKGLQYLNLSGSNTHVMLTNEKAEEFTMYLEQHPEALSNIQEIDLSRNVALSARTLGKLVTVIFKNCPNLETLRLRGYDSFSMIENEKAKALSLSLHHLPHKLEDQIHVKNNSHRFSLLDISYNTIDSGPLNMLYKSALEITSFQSMKVNETLLQNRDILQQSGEIKLEEDFSLLFYLQGGRILPSLQEVVITEIALINPSVLENLTKTLIGSCYQSLQKIRLIGSPKMEVLDDERVEMLSRLFEEYSPLLNSLEEVDFSWNSMNAGPIRLLLESVFMCSNIKNLRMSGSEQYSMITNTRAQALTEFFNCKERGLINLDLSFNKIDDASIADQLILSILMSNRVTIKSIGLYFMNPEITVIYVSSLYKAFNQQNLSFTPSNNYESSPYGRYAPLLSSSNKSPSSKFSFFSQEVLKQKALNQKDNLLKIYPADGQQKESSKLVDENKSLQQETHFETNKDNNNELNNKAQEEIIEYQQVALQDKYKSNREQTPKNISQPADTIHSKKEWLQGKFKGFLSHMLTIEKEEELPKWEVLEEINLYCQGSDPSQVSRLKRAMKQVTKAKIIAKHRKEGWEGEIQNNKDTSLNEVSVFLPDNSILPNAQIIDKQIIGQLLLPQCLEKMKLLLEDKKTIVIRREALEIMPLLGYCLTFNQSFSQLQFENLLKRGITTLVVGETFMKACRCLIPIRPEGNNLHSLLLNHCFFDMLEQQQGNGFSLSRKDGLTIKKKKQSLILKTQTAYSSNHSTQKQALPLEHLIFPSSSIIAGFERAKDPKFISRIFQRCEAMTFLKSIQLEYEFDQEQPQYADLKEQKIIQKLLLMPPTVIKSKPNANLNLLKAIYSILHDSLYFESSSIDYDHSSAINTGIVISLLESIYKIPKFKSIFSSLFFSMKKLLFYLLSFICKEEKIFSLDCQALQLNEDLPNKRVWLFNFSSLLIFLNFFQIFSQFSPIIFSNLSTTNTNHISLTSYYIFSFFGLISFLIEFFLYIDLLKYISHLIPGLQISTDKNIIARISNSFKHFLMNIKYFNYKILICGTQLLQSLIQRYDTFSDFSFIVICFQTKFYLLAWCSLATLSFNLTMTYFSFIRYLFRRRKQKRVLSTDNLMQYYKIAQLAECTALSEQLDNILPYNVKQLPDWWIFGSWRKQSISLRMFTYMLKFLFKNSPQIVFQIIYLLSSQAQTFNYTVVLSMTTSISSFCISFLNFLTIRPSTITQIDFNELAIQKQLNLLSEYEKQEKISNQQFQKAFPAYYFENCSKNIGMNKSSVLPTGNIPSELKEQQQQQDISMNKDKITNEGTSILYDAKQQNVKLIKQNDSNSRQHKNSFLLDNSLGLLNNTINNDPQE